MAGPVHGERRKRSRLVYLVPVLAAVLAVTVYALAIGPALSSNEPPAMNFVAQISIQVPGKFQNGTVGMRFVIPQGVGEPGYAWNVHKYDLYGLNGRYPVYMDPPAQTGYPGYSIIHVVSRVNHNYTLGDFFAVWGQPVGANDTLGIQNSGGYSWSMCVGPSAGSLRPGLWGQEVLAGDMPIILKYSSVGCL